MMVFILRLTYQRTEYQHMKAGIILVLTYYAFHVLYSVLSDYSAITRSKYTVILMICSRSSGQVPSSQSTW